MRYSKKGWEKRKRDREGLKDFFEDCIAVIKRKKLCCEECGSTLKGHVSEVAHILPKGSFRSIQTEDMNWIPLCGQFSSSQCHTNFDTFPVEEVKQMNIYPLVQQRFLILEDKIKEKISYKIYDKYLD